MPRVKVRVRVRVRVRGVRSPGRTPGRTAVALALNLVELPRVVGSDDAVLDGVLDREPLLVELAESAVHVVAQRLLPGLVQAAVDAFTCDLG